MEINYYSAPQTYVYKCPPLSYDHNYKHRTNFKNKNTIYTLS